MFIKPAAAQTASEVVSAGGAHKEESALLLPDKPSLAVLPFQNMSSDSEQEYFAMVSSKTSLRLQPRAVTYVIQKVGPAPCRTKASPITCALYKDHFIARG